MKSWEDWDQRIRLLDSTLEQEIERLDEISERSSRTLRDADVSRRSLQAIQRLLPSLLRRGQVKAGAPKQNGPPLPRETASRAEISR